LIKYLLDVNVLVALLDEDHVHHKDVLKWFDMPGIQWAICAFAEAGLLRHMARQKLDLMSLDIVSDMLDRLTQHPGYHYQPITADWQSLSAPIAKRLHGHNQVTDAFLLGLAIREEMVLATLDKGILHMAGDHRDHVLLLGASQTQ
jgi:predicted nucleic acid-binding protein